MRFTACYTKLEEGYGYMGQLLEWPNVITDGESLEDCRDSLIEVAAEMADIYEEDGLEIPDVSLTVETIDIPVKKSERALLAHVG
ncbi:MAG: type II toxin-antitoxin system HicB family antitoxin [Synergistaceae bacterium]|nr:type II toxin-antitoxin system HicB family antitoxin [Synergistaceae bacterium]